MYTPAQKIRITAYALLFCLQCFSLTASPQAAFTANQTIGCAPLTVQFTNSSTGAVSYYWDLGNGNTSSLVNPVNVYTTPGTYTVKLIATDASGITDTLVRTNLVTVANNPVADFSASDSSACPYTNQINFQNNSATGLTYLWDFGDGTISSQYSPTHSYTQSGLFSVSLMVTNALGCSETKTKTNFITIYPSPTASIAVNKTFACDKSQVFQFTGNPSTAVSWLWNFGDGTFSTLPSPQHTFNSIASFPVSLIVTDAHGCKDTTDTATHIIVMNKNWATFSVFEDSGCAPFSVKFYQNYAGTSSIWDFGDGTAAVAATPTHTYPNPGTYTVSVIVTHANGCIDTVTHANYIAVGTEPVANFSVGSTSGCSPYTASFTNLSTNYSQSTWNFGDGGTSQQNNPSYTYINAGTYPVTLTCRNAFGCVSTLEKSNLVNVTAPQALFGADTRSGCPPLLVTFTNSSFGGNPTYSWDFGDGSTSSQAAPVHTFNSVGNYTVTLTVTDSSGCTSTLVKQAYIQVTDPSAGYITPPTTTGCAPYTTSFTDGTAGAVAWLWNFGDGTTSTLQNPTHTYTTAGFYTVSLSAQSANGGCAGNISNFSSYDIQGGYAAFTDTFDQCPPYDVTFFDSSSGAVTWFWQFGDGTSSTLQNPTHTYALPGYHTVSLVVTTSAGCTHSSMQSNGIYFAPFAASFYSVPHGTTFPMVIDFYANSIGATGWLWDFGDSTFSSLENPSHVYPDSGDYNVTLTIDNGLCSLFYDPPPLIFAPPDTGSMHPPPSGSPPVPQYGCVPFNVSFAYQVKDAVSWLWLFGDGDSSTAQFPIHTYRNTGNYSVGLITTDSFGIANTFLFDTIVHVNGPNADFTFSQTPNCQFTQVNLQNNTTGALSYVWDFGDGVLDSTASPIHIYTSGRPNYIITLRATDSYGCQDIASTSMFANSVRPILVSETDVCGADTVRFSSGLTNYVSYLWDFGDGSTDSLASPWHIYTVPGSYIPSLTVTDPNGCTQTHASSYPVTVSIPLVSFSAPELKACDNLEVHFVNTTSNADSYRWNFGDGTISTNYQPVHEYNQAGLYTVSLTAYKNGCVDTLVKNDYIRVDTAHAGFQVALNGICLPFTATFTDQSVNPVTWSWDFGDFGVSSQQNPVHVYDSIAPFKNVMLTVVDSNGCKDSETAPMFSGPQLAIRADKTAGCMPLTVSFKGTIQYASSYHWDFGDGTTSTQPSPVHTYSAPGNYRVKLVATSLAQFGLCTDSIYFNDTIRVVQPLADFSSPDLSACAPSLVNFTNSSRDGDTYLWNFGDGSTSNSVSPSHLYKNPGLYSVSLVTSSTLGCSDSLLRNQYIRVLGPQTNFSISDTSGCIPHTAAFVDSSIDAVSWMWNFGDGYTQASQYPTHTYSDSGVYSVTLITTDTGGCTSFLEYPFHVHVNPNPVAAYSVNDSTGCGILTAGFTNQTSGFSSIWWNFGDGGFSIAGNPNHTYATAGQYTVSLIAYNRYGCTDTVASNHPMTVLVPPVAAFGASATEGCSPFTVTFENHSTDTLGATYSWDFGNGLVRTGDEPTVTFVNPGLYTVSLTVTNANGCGDTSTVASLIHVRDTLAPVPSEILTASVQSDSIVQITWENNAAIDLGAYKLYRLNENTGLYELIYTDLNPANSSFSLTSTYTDQGLNTLRHSYTYKLQTLDICENTLDLDQLKAHTTINIEAVVSGYDVRVTWNAYGGCPVSGYDLFRATPSSPFQLIATVPADSLAYTDSAFVCPDQYIYKVVATSLCSRPYVSISDTTAARPHSVFDQQVVDMVRSTVVDNDYVLTEWLPPVIRPLGVLRYDLYRADDNIHFEFISSVPPQQTDYSDHDVDVQKHNYFYKIRVVNTCDTAEVLSNPTTTILLIGEKTEDRVVHLKWSPYDRWVEGVDYYIIETQEENGQWKFVTQTPGTKTTVEFRDE